MTPTFLILLFLSFGMTYAMGNVVITNPATGIYQASFKERPKDILEIEIRHDLNSKNTSAWLRYQGETKTLEKIEMYNAMLDHLWGNGELQKIDSLGLGRIEAFPHLVKMGTLLIAKNKSWDFKRGRPRKGISANAFYADILNQCPVNGEPLRAKLFDYKIKASFTSLEKVLVLRVKELEWSKELIDAGLGPLSLVPIDAITWLKLGSL